MSGRASGIDAGAKGRDIGATLPGRLGKVPRHDGVPSARFESTQFLFLSAQAARNSPPLR